MPKLSSWRKDVKARERLKTKFVAALPTRRPDRECDGPAASGRRSAFRSSSRRRHDPQTVRSITPGPQHGARQPRYDRAQLDWDGQMPSVSSCSTRTGSAPWASSRDGLPQSLRALVTGCRHDRATGPIGVVARAIASQRGELG
jgi:hypothetical protein